MAYVEAVVDEIALEGLDGEFAFIYITPTAVSNCVYWHY